MAYDVPPPEQCPEPGYYYHYKHDPDSPPEEGRFEPSVRRFGLPQNI